MLFFEWMRKVVWAISRKLESGYFLAFQTLNNVNHLYISKKQASIFENLWTEPAFRANLLFGYAQSGPGRTSFSASNVEFDGNLKAQFRI